MNITETGPNAYSLMMQTQTFSIILLLILSFAVLAFFLCLLIKLIKDTQ